MRHVSLKKTDSILMALRTIEESPKKIALILDEQERLIGTLTDGDIRRGLLKGISLDQPVALVMNENPHVVREGENMSHYLEEMKKNLYRHLPIVDAEGRVQEVYYINDFLQTRHFNNHVVIMAGGKGERLRPITETIPKPMVEINDKPLLEHLIVKLKEIGFSQIVLSVNYKKNIIQDYFQDGHSYGVNITYIEEDQPLGTAGSLGLWSYTPTESFIVMNADLVTNLNFLMLLDYHKTHQSDVTVCVREHNYMVPFGVVQMEHGHVKEIVEKPTHSFLVSAGIYVLEPRVLQHIEKNRYLDMPDLLRHLLTHHYSIGGFTLYEDWIDIGRIDDLNKARGFHL